MRRLIICLGALTAVAGPAVVAHAALPRADYHFAGYKDDTHQAKVDVKGRRTVSSIEVTAANTCVRPGITLKKIPISRGGRFIATRQLSSTTSDRKLPGKAHFRGLFTSSDELVLRVKFTNGRCSSKEFRFELLGSEYEDD